MILIDSWPYDLLVSGEISLSSEMTDNPVESGGTTGDHINLLPVEFTAECIVSDTPVGEIASHESRRVEIPHRGERVDERIDVVPIDRPEVPEA